METFIPTKVCLVLVLFFLNLEFHGLEEEVFLKVLELLENRGLAKVFHGEGGGTGVKFS